MNSSKFSLESLIENPKYRMVGLMVAAVFFLISVGFFVASKNVSSHRMAGAVKAVLPAEPYNLPIVRYLPNTQPMKNRIVEALPTTAPIARR